LDEIRRQIDVFNGHFCQIIIVSYAADYDEYKTELKKYFDRLNYEIVQVKDVLNPGFANLNRQVVQLQAGLAAAENGNFIVKLRNDQNINFNKLFAIVEKYNLFCNDEIKILTTNCFSRKDRLYHPSDMFICASKSVLLQYFDYPYMQKTEIQYKMEISEIFIKNPKMTFNPIAPESKLFRNFLRNNQWHILETKKDSAAAMKKYTYLFNSWDIDLRWKKKRNYPFEFENEIILPHYFTLAPFEGAPKEVHQCWLRHEIMGGFMNKRDYKFVRLAKNSCRDFEKSITPYKNNSIVNILLLLFVPLSGILIYFRDKKLCLNFKINLDKLIFCLRQNGLKYTINKIYNKLVKTSG
jgi:hypothetical protein